MTVSSAGGASASLLLALAVSVNDPLLRSSWVIVCVPVHVIDLPGARLATGIAGVQLNPSSAGVSLTVTLCKRGVAFVGRRDGVFDDLTDFVVLRRVQVVRLGQPELRRSVRL